jgi:hypothetical protein
MQEAVERAIQAAEEEPREEDDWLFFPDLDDGDMMAKAVQRLEQRRREVAVASEANEKSIEKEGDWDDNIEVEQQGGDEHPTLGMNSEAEEDEAQSKTLANIDAILDFPKPLAKYNPPAPSTQACISFDEQISACGQCGDLRQNKALSKNRRWCSECELLNPESDEDFIEDDFVEDDIIHDDGSSDGDRSPSIHE